MSKEKSNWIEYKAKGYWDWLKHEIIDVKDNFRDILEFILPVIAILLFIITMGLCLTSGGIAFFMFNVNFWHSLLIEVIGVVVAFFGMSYFFYWCDKDSVVYTHITDSPANKPLKIEAPQACLDCMENLAKTVSECRKCTSGPQIINPKVEVS